MQTTTTDPLDFGARLASDPPGPWAIEDARGAIHMRFDREEEADAKADEWNAQTDPAQRVDDGAYPFVVVRRA